MTQSVELQRIELSSSLASILTDPHGKNGNFFEMLKMIQNSGDKYRHEIAQDNFVNMSV